MGEQTDKVLLVLDGDPAGAKAAAREVASEVRQTAEAVKASATEQAAAQEKLDAAFDQAREKEIARAENQAALRAEGQAAFDRMVDEEIAASQERVEAKEAAIAAEVEAERQRAAQIESAEAGVRKAEEESAKAVEAVSAREVAALRQAMEARAQKLIEANRAKGMGENESRNLAQTQLNAEVDAMGKAAFAAKNLEERAHGVRGLSQALGLVSPQAAGAARAIHDLQEGIEFIGTKGGMAMLGAAGVIGLVIAGITELNRVFEENKKHWDDMQAAQQRLRGQTTERQGTMAEALAKQGKGSQEALDKGMSAARRLEEMGYSRQAAQEVAAATIGADGASTVSPEEEELLAAAVQTGQVSLGGKTPREREAALRKARQFINRNREDVTNAAAALKRPRQMQNQAAAEGDQDALVAALKRDANMSDEEAQQYAQAMRQFGSGGAEYSTEFFSTDAWTGKASAKRAAWEKADEGWRRLGNIGGRGQGGVQATAHPSAGITLNNYGVAHVGSPGPQPVQRQIGG